MARKTNEAENRQRREIRARPECFLRLSRMNNGEWEKFVRLSSVDHSLWIGINYHLIAARWRFVRWKMQRRAKQLENYKLSAIICANYFYFFLRTVGNLRRANPRRSRNRP